MNRFRRSRGRVSLEILCALTISLSLAGAWLQTGAWALLPASLAALICSMTLAADLKGGGKVPAAGPQRIDFDSDLAGNAAEPAGDAPAPSADLSPAPRSAEKAAPKARAARPKGSSRPRKAGPKKAGAARAADQQVESPPRGAEPPVSEEPLPQPGEEPAQLFTGEPQHPPVAPLFEPEPFVRQQRAVFGRKAG